MADHPRTPISAKDLIDACLLVEGEGNSLISIPGDVPLTEALELKLLVYRLAALSYAIIMVGQARESLLALQSNLEDRVSAMHDEAIANGLREEMRNAVADIHDLVNSDKKPSWARSWFRAVNWELTNSVEAGLFSMSVLGAVNHYVRILDMYDVAS